MLVQNDSFDINKFQPGFRYNENWSEDFPGDGDKSHLYQPYFTHRHDIIEDWANSKRVAPLIVQFQEPDKLATKEFEKRFGDGTLTGTAKDLMLVILPYENRESHLRQQSSNDDHTSAAQSRRELGPMIVLNANGAWLYRRDTKKIYRSTPWDRTLKILGPHQESP